jgi:hypothetical protein
MNQALPFGLKRKVDKLSKWESQSPAGRSLSDHAQRLESRAGSLGISNRIERLIDNHGAAILDWIPASRLGAYSPVISLYLFIFSRPHVSQDVISSKGPI